MLLSVFLAFDFRRGYCSNRVVEKRSDDPRGSASDRAVVVGMRKALKIDAAVRGQFLQTDRAIVLQESGKTSSGS
jgi:hypothetical protein